jgi:predicted dehydrogenase
MIPAIWWVPVDCERRRQNAGRTGRNIRPPALMTHTGLGWSTSGKGRSLEERAIFAGNRGRVQWRPQFQSGGCEVGRCRRPGRREHGADGEKDFSGQALETIPFDSAGWKFKAQVRGVAEFAAALSRNEPPPVDPLEASYVIRVIEKAYASARASGEPVTV